MSEFEKKIREDFAEMLNALSTAIYEQMTRPSAVFAPRLFSENGKWFAAHGDDRTGLLAEGDTPAEAMADFDRKWGSAQPTAVAADYEEETHVINMNAMVDEAVTRKLEEIGVVAIRRKH